MSYYGVSPPSLLSWLNPLDAINNVFQIILYFLAMALYYLAELVNLLFSVIEGMVSGIVGMSVQAVSGLGILSLPVFVILLFSFFSFALIFMMVLHDIPVVGAVA